MHQRAWALTTPSAVLLIFHLNILMKPFNPIAVFVRGKRTGPVSPSTQKVVNQLSALSASRKQPRLLKLCDEDLIKHKTIMNAWTLYQRKKQQKQTDQLRKQYESIQAAMDELKEASPQHYQWANQVEKKRFPLEMKVPTEYPADQPWVYNYRK